MGHVDEFDERVGRYARQLGLTSVQLHAPKNLPGVDGYWTTAELAALQSLCADAGLSIDGLENVPVEHFWKIQRGVSGRDEQIENYIRTIRNMGSVGITMLGHNFLPTFVWRTDMSASGRGGARITSFDLADAIRDGNGLDHYKLSPQEPIVQTITAAQMWSNYEYFLEAVLPVAEEAGVQLALHPDDPPVDIPLGGAARIFTTPADLVRAAACAHDSPAWGLNLCLGTISAMGGEDAANAVVDALGPTGKIFYVHFRDVIGTVPHFAEGFLGEGNMNPARVLRRLRDNGFTGFIIDDHVPAIEGDVDTWLDTSSDAYCSRGRAHAIGYLQGVLNALDLN